MDYIINLPSESNTKVYINEVGVAEYGCRGDINGDNETNVRDAGWYRKILCYFQNLKLVKHQNVLLILIMITNLMSEMRRQSQEIYPRVLGNNLRLLKELVK